MVDQFGRRAIVTAVFLTASFSACAPPPPTPAAVTIRETPPPWSAPRDAVSYIEAAGLPLLDQGYQPIATRVASLQVFVEGETVEVPAGIGIDRIRAVEAPLHTHAADGTVWVEEVDAARVDDYTLGDFFALWGVRFDARCLGDACGVVTVTVDDVVVEGDPTAVGWAEGAALVVRAER